MQNTNVEKNLQFEYIRAFSIVAVITIHTFYSALLNYGGGQHLSPIRFYIKL